MTRRSRFVSLISIVGAVSAAAGSVLGRAGCTLPSKVDDVARPGVGVPGPSFWLAFLSQLGGKLIPVPDDLMFPASGPGAG